MNKMCVIIIGLAMLTVAPMGILAQNSDAGTGAESSTAADSDAALYWYYVPEQSGFDYADGVANGTYVDFTLDESTGTISDYTSTIIDYNYFYPMVYYEDGRMNGDGYGSAMVNYTEPTEYTIKFFDTIAIEGFVPNGHPLVLGQSLYYMGDNVLATLTDYEYSSVCLQFGESNSTVTITVPDGIQISHYPRYYEMYDIEPGNMTVGQDSAAGGIGAGEYYGFEEPQSPWFYQWDEAYLTAGNVTCSIWVNYGTLEIDGQHIIIQTYPGASVSTSSWIDYGWTYEYQEPWFSDVPSEGDKGAIEGAMESGLMAAVGYLFMGDDGVQSNDAQTMNDPSFQLEFTNVEQNRFQVQVDSDITTGRIVTLNVNREMLEAQNVDEIKVLLDGENVHACGSMEVLVDMQGGAEAGYYMVSGTNQNTIFVYVPHFSTHIITVGLTESQVVNVVLPAAVAAAFIAAAVGVVMVRGKRNKDDL
jgi:hypothetical protein